MQQLSDTNDDWKWMRWKAITKFQWFCCWWSVSCTVCCGHISRSPLSPAKPNQKTGAAVTHGIDLSLNKVGLKSSWQTRGTKFGKFQNLKIYHKFVFVNIHLFTSIVLHIFSARALDPLLLQQWLLFGIDTAEMVFDKQSLFYHRSLMLSAYVLRNHHHGGTCLDIAFWTCILTNLQLSGLGFLFECQR